MTPRILPAAFGDLEDGRDFYNSQQSGVGTYFLNSIFADVESLRLYASIHGKRYGYHRLLAVKFPYAIYYQVEGDEVIIYRILDCRSDPKKHRKALQ